MAVHVTEEGTYSTLMGTRIKRIPSSHMEVPAMRSTWQHTHVSACTDPITRVMVCTHAYKGAEEGHYKLTLNTRTTMVWMALLTMLTLLCMVPYTLTTEGMGIHTLSMVGMAMSTMATLVMGITHLWVRTHGCITLSTHYMEKCTHCGDHHHYGPFECEYGVTHREFYGL